MSAEEPRRHHYIPASYLAGFTQSGNRDSKLYVFDQESLKSWVSTPEETAHERDFYRLDPDENIDEFAVEKALGEFEGISIPVLKKIVETYEIPTGEEFNLLLNFISLMIVRTPHARYLIIEPMKQVAKLSIEMALSDEKKYEILKERLREKGKKIDESVTYEQLKEFLHSDRYDLVLNQNFLINFMNKGVDTLLPLLADRNWAVMKSKSSDHHFVCSEHPVSITWSDRRETVYPPGFGHENTDVIFPINKTMVIIGRFEELEPFYEIEELQTASINNRTAQWGGRFVYSAENNIIWMKEDQSVGNKSELLESLKRNQG